MRGLIVTLEPYHFVHSGLVDEWLGETSVPTTTASVRELEELVALARVGPDLAQQLTQVQNDPERRTWSPLSAARDLWPCLVGNNPILETAGDELSWHSGQPDPQ